MIKIILKKMAQSIGLATAAVLLLFSCTLEKEPSIPTGATNEEKPVFQPTELLAATDSSLHLEVRLSALGNLNIQHHGWIWRDGSGGTAQFLPDLGALKAKAFDANIKILKVGTTQFFQPYLVVGADTTFGIERCFFAGTSFEFNTYTRIFQGAKVKFKNTSAGPVSETSWDFGDGSTSASNNPTHVFNQLGKITVRLTAKIGDCVGKKEVVFEVIPDVFKDYWVALSGGVFMMGCTPEQGSDCNSSGDFSELPVHQVTLSPFEIGRSEVTQEQWRTVMGDDPSFFFQCGDNCPVELVSWKQVDQQFVPRLDSMTGRRHRLPTEAEWEFAARGGLPPDQMTKFAGSNNLSDVGWVGDPYFKQEAYTHPVEQKKPNGFGLYDMSGNVGEWCDNKFPEAYPADPQIDPMSGTVGGQKRVIRGFVGGSFLVFTDTMKVKKFCRVTSRDGSEPGSRLPWVGFRLVRK